VPASVTYYLDTLPVKFTRFKSTIGLGHEAVSGRGSADFAVELMRNGAWKKAYVSKVFRGGDKPENIEVDIFSAQALRFRTTDANDGINSDHATWGNPRLE